jgi:general nucleoside transport system permease protein
MDADLATALAASTVLMAVPLLLAALGEIVAEKGLLLTGAFTAMVAAHFSQSTALGIGAAILAGVLLGALFALVVVALAADQVVAGTALNLFALGLTGVLYRAAFGVTGSALTVAAPPLVPLPLLSALPVLGPSLFTQTLLGYAAFLLAFLLRATRPGLALRMVGENPYAAETQGVRVARIRFAALVLSGALAAAGGAYLALAYTRTFVEGMSAGRGFIALAIVIVARWSPWGALAASLLFGLVTALQFHFQALGVAVPYQFFLMMPYVLTLVVLAAYGTHGRAPAALGR